MMARSIASYLPEHSLLMEWPSVQPYLQKNESHRGSAKNHWLGKDKHGVKARQESISDCAHIQVNVLLLDLRV
jgi:hypothetical protein